MTAERAEIRDRVVSIMTKVFNVDDARALSLSPSNCEEWDSVRHMEVIFSVEEEFEIMFDEKDMSGLDGVEKITDAVCEALGSSPREGAR